MQVLSPEPGEPTSGAAVPLTPALLQGLAGSAADIPALSETEHSLEQAGAITGPRISPAMTLFQQVVAANGLDPSARPTVGIQNFVVGPASRDGVPFAPLSDPYGDIYLGFSGPAAAGDTDIVITNRCQPEYLDYLRGIGLLAETTVVIEVDPQYVPGKIGWPYTDPMSRLMDLSDQRPSIVAAREQLNAIIAERGKPYFVSTFLPQSLREHSLELGLQPVQQSDPVNINKASFRNAAAKYGFTISDGMVVNSEMDLPALTSLAVNAIIRRVQNETPYETADDRTTKGWTALWMKLQDGSGGDFVKKVFVPQSLIEKVSETIGHGLLQSYPPELIASTLSAIDEGRELEAALGDLIVGARNEVRKTLDDACHANDYGPRTLERMWPGDSFAPTAVRMVAEQDARVDGTMLANASNVVVINSDGSYYVDGNFKQVTGSDGSYRGSYPYSPVLEFGADVARRIDREVDAIVKWIYDQGFRGRIGIDFFVMRDIDGNVRPIMTEVNGRAPISGVSKVIADKLGAPAWLNINIESPTTLNSMQEFRAAFGEFADFVPGDFSKARVIPQAMRALYIGEEMIYSSPKVKALIVGPTQEACFQLREELSRRGFIL